MLSRKKLCFALAAAFATSSVQAAAFNAQQYAQPIAWFPRNG